MNTVTANMPDEDDEDGGVIDDVGEIPIAG